MRWLRHAIHTLNSIIECALHACTRVRIINTQAMRLCTLLVLVLGWDGGACMSSTTNRPTQSPHPSLPVLRCEYDRLWVIFHTKPKLNICHFAYSRILMRKEYGHGSRLAGVEMNLIRQFRSNPSGRNGCYTRRNGDPYRLSCSGC